jgi:hypothetical protein
VCVCVCGWGGIGIHFAVVFPVLCLFVFLHFLLTSHRTPHSSLPATLRFLTNQKTGWRTLFRGVLPNVIQAIPGGAVSMLAFEFTLAALGPSTVRPVGERLKAIKDKVTGMRDFTVYV